MTTYVTNELETLLNLGKSAKKIFDDVNKSAELKFGKKTVSAGGASGPKEGDTKPGYTFSGGKWVKDKPDGGGGKPDKTDPYTVELKQKEEAYKESQLEIM